MRILKALFYVLAGIFLTIVVVFFFAYVITWALVILVPTLILSLVIVGLMLSWEILSTIIRFFKNELKARKTEKELFNRLKDEAARNTRR